MDHWWSCVQNKKLWRWRLMGNTSEIHSPFHCRSDYITLVTGLNKYYKISHGLFRQHTMYEAKIKWKATLCLHGFTDSNLLSVKPCILFFIEWVSRICLDQLLGYYVITSPAIEDFSAKSSTGSVEIKWKSSMSTSVFNSCTLCMTFWLSEAQREEGNLNGVSWLINRLGALVIWSGHIQIRVN